MPDLRTQPPGPAEDIGATTYEAFRRQATVALPYVAHLFTGTVMAIVMERVDDFIVLGANGLVELHQVKTRSTGAYWTIAQLTDAAGNDQPLKRMFARFGLVRGVESLAVLHIEGPLDSAARKLADDCEAGRGAEHAAAIRTRIGATDDTRAAEFLERVRIRADVLPRDIARDLNIARVLLPFTAGRLDGSKTAQVYQELIDRVAQAIEGEPLKTGDWLIALMERRSLPDEVERRTLTAGKLERFRWVFALAPGRHLVAGLPVPDATAMERKLREGRADDGVIEQAKELRANSYTRILEYLDGPSENEKDLQDLRLRLMTVIREVLAEFDDRPRPANRIYAQLSRIARDRPEAIDVRNVFGDTNLLLGLAYQLCDECSWDLA